MNKKISCQGKVKIVPIFLLSIWGGWLLCRWWDLIHLKRDYLARAWTASTEHRTQPHIYDKLQFSAPCAMIPVLFVWCSTVCDTSLIVFLLCLYSAQWPQLCHAPAEKNMQNYTEIFIFGDSGPEKIKCNWIFARKKSNRRNFKGAN